MGAGTSCADLVIYLLMPGFYLPMSRFLQGLRLYAGATCAYGAVHAIPALWPKTDMLVVDKVFTGAALTVSTVFVWPFLLRRDLVYLECLVRGKQARDFL